MSAGGLLRSGEESIPLPGKELLGVITSQWAHPRILHAILKIKGLADGSGGHAGGGLPSGRGAVC